MKKATIFLIALFLATLSITIAYSYSVYDRLIPLAIGNKWVYKSGSDIITEEVIEKRKVYLDNFYDEEVEVYIINRNGKEKDLKAIKEKKGITFVMLDKEYQSENAPVFTRYQTFIPNEPSSGYYDPKEKIHKHVKYIWLGKDSVSVPAGNFETFYNEFKFDTKDEIIRTYYALGVGLVKTVTLNSKGDILNTLELMEYSVKED